MRGGIFLLLVSLIVSIMVLTGIVSVSALYIQDDDFFGAGHSIKIKNVSVVPENLIPGKEGVLKIIIENGAKLAVEDLRIQLNLPPEIKFFGDVSSVKLSRLDSKETQEIEFRIITSPTAKEVIYESNLLIDYVNYFGTTFENLGENRQDNYTLGLIIKSEPVIFVEIDDSSIYRKRFNRINNIGEVSIKFVNNGLADIKFLTVVMESTSDYEVISSSKKYIGDLDSDDFDLLDFNLKIKEVRNEYNIPIVIDFKDSLNNDYQKRIDLNLKVRTAKELGIDSNGTFYYVLTFVIIFGIGYYIYISYLNKKKNKVHHKMNSK